MERFHRTLRQEFLTGKVFDAVTDAQVQLDAWVETYNHDRPHQGIGMVAPNERFRLAISELVTVEVEDSSPDTTTTTSNPTRRVGQGGNISFAATRYRVGTWLTGEEVEVICDERLLHIHHRGVLVVTHAVRHAPSRQSAAERRGQRPAPPASAKAPPRKSASAASVTRKVDSSGNVSFAGTN